ALGVGPESRVGVLAGRTPELVVGMLAAMRAGGAYVPLDPALPAARLEFVAADAGVSVVLATAALRGSAPGGIPVLPLDGAAQDADAGAPDGSQVPLDAVAFVIYTSGSTGTPKGVEVTHRGLLDLTRWYVDAFGIGADDRGAQLAGLGFDASVWEALPYLAAGASVHQVTDEETRASPAALQAFMLESGVTLAFVTTVLGEGLMELEWPERTPLRALLTGGEALRSRPREGTPFAVLNVYGPTETTLVCTGGVVEPGDGGGRLPPIGRPLANVRAYVLDGALQPAAVGVPGELYVGGPGVARGYGGRPGPTAEKFVPDPLSAEPGARLYRTGDRVRWLPSGEIEFLGRIDQQVKLRGFRIEPGEVEAVLLAHPGVREAAVLVRDDAPGGRQLIAYAVARAEGAAEAGELRAWLRERLPDYMVPAAFVALDSIPRTPSGKTDRRALPAPEPSAPATPRVAPRTPVEEEVAAVWAEVLGVERVGIHDDFFEHGGHSLRAAQVVSRVRGALGADLSLRDLFDAPTVAELAARVEARRPASAAEAIENRLEWLESLSEEEALRLLGEL
ncbi:MAG: non-ribosomal peptide synthetase, partial [Gemmatimonadota bacterium]